MSRITAQNWRWTQWFWSPAKVTLIQGQRCRPVLLREVLNIPPSQPLIWIQGPQSQSHCGRVQRSKSCFLFYCNLPLNSPKISKGTNQQIFSNSLHIYKGQSHLGKYLSFNMKTQCLWHSENDCPYSLSTVSHTGHQCLLTNRSSKIQSALCILALVLHILAQFIRGFFSKANACQISSVWTSFLLGLLADASF